MVLGLLLDTDLCMGRWVVVVKGMDFGAGPSKFASQLLHVTVVTDLRQLNLSVPPFLHLFDRG